MPSGSVLRFGSRVMARFYRLTAGRSSGDMLLLTTVGARSGEQRIASLRRFDDGDDRWLVVGSAGGQAKHPAWLHNLAQNPEQAWVEVGRERTKVHPELLSEDERAAAWTRIVAEAPQFGAYEHKTDREIPVVRLTRSP